MLRAMFLCRPATWLLSVSICLLGTACQPEIGDSCRTSTDCSLNGERICDLSVRVDGDGNRTPNGRGECTIEGCGRGTCPSEARCVKVYSSAFLSVSCDPEREDMATVDEMGQTLPPLDECQPNEVCLPEGLCADEITARTSCRRRCDSGGDCRDGYFCQRTGSAGVYRAPDLEDPDDTRQTKVCMPLPL